MTETVNPTAPDAATPGDPDAQDATVTAPESPADGSDEAVEQIDTDALLESVKSKDLAAYGVLSMAAKARTEFQGIVKQLAEISAGKDNFDSLMTKHGDDERIAELNRMRVAILAKLNEVQTAGQTRLAELGVTTTAVTEQEKAALKEKRSATRKQLKDALALFRNYLENVEVNGAEEFLKVADALEPPKSTDSSTGDTDNTAIREWAKANNIAVGEKGRIAKTVVDQYNKAMAAKSQVDSAA